MKQYHCLVAGLPEIKLDDTKSPFTLKELKEDLKNELSEKDYSVVHWLFLNHDNKNLLSYLQNKEAGFNDLGDLTASDFDSFLKLLNEEEQPEIPELPDYMRQYLQLTLEEDKKQDDVNQADVLNSLYFSEAVQQKNEFAADWFQLQLNVLNIITALNCRKYELPIENYIVGDNEIARALKTNTGRDFGIGGMFDYFDQVVRISEETDFEKKEKMLDALYWNYLEEKSFFYFFTVERLFVYLLQLQIVERWSVLESGNGKEVFLKMVDEMKGNVQFSDEFNV